MTQSQMRVALATTQMERDLVVAMLKHLVQHIPMDQRRAAVMTMMEEAMAVRPIRAPRTPAEGDQMAAILKDVVAGFAALLVPALGVVVPPPKQWRSG